MAVEAIKHVPQTGQAAQGPVTAERPSAERPISDADVPQHPGLAPEVELAGAMEDSAFTAQPWLVVRNGDFVQISELLYRLAEQCDGERSLSQVAQALGDAIDREVTEDNVRQLLRDKLIPLGIVPKADGTVVPTGRAAGQSRSPLQMNMRMAVIGPRVIEPIARPLQVFFVAPLLLLFVTLGLGAAAWVFLVQGLGGGLHSAMYEPWLILVLLPVIVASAAFHEFGHAAALMYGGGRVRGMGAGFYLLYPAFYTDVTDNYRLSRWKRVRTDTGGFYFNLLFGLGILGLYFVTGYEFLLLAMLFIAFSIVHQSLPFVRLDGYWTLADLTGMPDFFSYMGPFLRSLWPFGDRRAARPPQLKAWVRIVFILYMLITIPLLLVMLIYMLSIAPRVLATAADSFILQVATLGATWSIGDALGIATALVSLVILALTAGGFLYFLYRMGKTVLGRLWGWGRQSPGRRLVAGVVTVGMAAGLAYLWHPPLEITANQPGPGYQHFRPIEPGERLTIPQAIGAQLAIGSAPGTPAEAAPTAPEEGEGGTEALEPSGSAPPEDADLADSSEPSPSEPASPSPDGDGAAGTDEGDAPESVAGTPTPAAEPSATLAPTPAPAQDETVPTAAPTSAPPLEPAPTPSPPPEPTEP